MAYFLFASLQYIFVAFRAMLSFLPFEWNAEFNVVELLMVNASTAESSQNLGTIHEL